MFHLLSEFLLFRSVQGYLTQNGYVNLERVEMIMQAVGVAEDNIFKKRKEDEVKHFFCSLFNFFS